MKKLLILLLFAASFLSTIPAHAAGVFGFLDGNFYDVNGNFKYICFLDGSCLGADGSVYLKQDILATDTPTPYTLNSIPQDQLVPITPVVIPVTPISQPTQPATGTSTPAPVIPTIDTGLWTYDLVAVPDSSSTPSFVRRGAFTEWQKRGIQALIFDGQTLIDNTGTNAIQWSDDSGNVFPIHTVSGAHATGTLTPETNYTYQLVFPDRIEIYHFETTTSLSPL